VHSRIESLTLTPIFAVFPFVDPHAGIPTAARCVQQHGLGTCPIFNAKHATFIWFGGGHAEKWLSAEQPESAHPARRTSNRGKPQGLLRKKTSLCLLRRDSSTGYSPDGCRNTTSATLSAIAHSLTEYPKGEMFRGQNKKGTWRYTVKLGVNPTKCSERARVMLQQLPLPSPPSSRRPVWTRAGGETSIYPLLRDLAIMEYHIPSRLG
jgi:hypothetical protein